MHMWLCMGLSRHHATSVTLAVSMPPRLLKYPPSPPAPSCSPGELALLLTKSVCPLTTTLFGEGGGGGGEGGAGGGGGGGGGGGVVMSSGGVIRQADKRPRRGGGGGKKAVGAVFKESLDSLLRMLHATSPHFIRRVTAPSSAHRPQPNPNPNPNSNPDQNPNPNPNPSPNP